MIPRLDQLEGPRRLYQELLDALPGAGFRGEISRDLGTRLVAATDNSVYQVLPQAVVHPLDADCVRAFVRLVSEPRFREISYTVRGGGTGTNGQALAEGVIVDVSRHMRRILEVDLERGVVRVEPGVVLDQLNKALEPHGVFFAPNLSPSSRATLGGMIATNACGKGSRVHGRTSEHIEALEVVLSDGSTLRTEPLDEAGLARAKAEPGLAGHVHRVVDELVTAHQPLIAERFPKLQRFMTGYDLARVAHTPRARFELSNLISGAEGTLGVVVEATLRLTPLPTCARLVVLEYASFEAALGSARLIAASDPSAIETVDETVMRLARQDVIWHSVGPLIDVEGHPRPAAINLVEYAGHDADAIEAKVRALLESVEQHRGEPSTPYLARVAADAGEARALWELRKKGVGLLGNAPGARKPIPFVEDTVVPPERLAEYVTRFRAILDAEGLQYGMFGHVDVGCLHVRPALDMKDPADERRMRVISDKVSALVQSYGGMLWGEHGKGFRSEYNPDYFGPELFAVLCTIKRAFDPHGQLNPGKIAVPEGGSVPLVSVDAPTRGQQDRQIPPAVRDAFAVTIDCNGNGQCFSWDPDHVMCPSSKVTRDRIHSPKGRAGLMREWLRQLTHAGLDPAQALRQRPSAWGAPLRWLTRAFHSAGRRLGRYDYSHEVAEAMAGCLACKACATQCPIKVDVPRFRAEFMDLYHRRYLRPPRDRMIGALEGLLPWLARAPRLVNALQQNPLSRALIRGLLGMVDTPPLAERTFARGLRERGIARFDAATHQALPPAEQARTVALVPDAFTTFYEAEVALAALDLIAALGFRPVVMPYRPSGKGWHVKGYLARFERAARRAVEPLREAARLGLPLVGLDPAVVLVYRDEIPHALGAGEPAPRVQLFQEWLVAQTPALQARASAAPAAFRLLGHCTERTAAPAAERQWRDAFQAAGLSLAVEAVGCCGMCGAYGHEAVHREESRGIFAMSWARRIPADPEARAGTLATGHSCRSQVKRFAGFVPLHPVQVLARALVPPPDR
ncbi:MAG: FAD-binding oxidoreductase [Deltaproteobacteria bacterium]|nr:FAD-binding oxidoreductase [Deltaproteobacteria bacterium]